MSSAPIIPGAALTVERAGHEQLDEVMAVMDSAFAPSFGEAWTRSQCAGILPLAGVELLVARDGAGGSALGFALLRSAADECELLLLAVAGGAQRRGVGRALMQQFEQSAGRAGARHLHLEVRSSNPAVRFYEAAGFAVAGRRRAYYRGRDGSEHDALTLAKTIED